MVRRFASFREMLAAQDRGNTAFGYFEGDTRKQLTYGEVLELIENYPIPEEDVIGVFCDNSILSLVTIFALAGKKQLVLLNPMDEPRVLESEIKAAHVSQLIGQAPEDMVLPALVLDQQRLCSSAWNGGSLLPLSESDNLLSVLPHAHVFGFVCSLLWPLSFGAKVSLGRGLKRIFMDISEFRPTAMSLVPEMAAFLASRKLFNPELKLILIGAGPCSDRTLETIRAMGIRVSYGYGLTESSSGIALSLSEDPRAMTVCPDHTVSIEADGEISVICDTTLMKGYYEDASATEAVLQGDKLFTGDLGRLEDGKLFITGRKKDILVLADGTKIFLPEYEERLRQVLGPDSDFAVIQLKSGALALAAAKPKKAENAVDIFNAGYPRGQRISKIIYVDELPKTSTGKIRRYEITGE